MQTTNRPLRPRDRNIDARMKVLGVLGFLLLAAAFFSVGVFCIGPRLGSARQTVKQAETVPDYVPPRSSPPPANEDQLNATGPDIKLEVTEEGTSAPGADEPSQGSDVTVDENGLTITLDGNGSHSGEQASDGNVPRTVEPKRSTSTSVTPSKPAPTQTRDAGRSSGSSLEKPRAATEKHTTAAPARD